MLEIMVQNTPIIVYIVVFLMVYNNGELVITYWVIIMAYGALD